jgi:uncharacterized protein with ParB-like and HNH nuclease domain
MNYKDIPQLTRCGNYQINVALNYLPTLLDDYKQDDLQLEPDFQRGHVWDEEKQIRYIEFLLRGGNTNNVIYFNCPGWMGDFKGDFVLVDGLQRITACLKFLEGKLKVFGHYKHEIEGKLDRDVQLIININNLKTRKEVLQWYLDMNSGGVVHTTEELDKVKQLLSKEE